MLISGLHCCRLHCCHRSAAELTLKRRTTRLLGRTAGRLGLRAATALLVTVLLLASIILAGISVGERTVCNVCPISLLIWKQASDVGDGILELL